MGGDNVGTGRGIYQKPQMSEGRLLTFQAIFNVALTLSLVLGAVLCYLLAVPFLSAIVWSVTLALQFLPLEAKIQSPGFSAAAAGFVDTHSAAIAASLVVSGKMTAVDAVFLILAGCQPIRSAR